ncbi:MAG: Uma2 family endonuclease [Thermosynechococcaceae cyanobacterium]
MTYTLDPTVAPPPFPDHTQLPESDSTFVKNFQEHPQSILLTDSLGPVLEKLHPDQQYCIGQDSGIYWQETDPPEQGAVSPDWFYVPNVPPKLGTLRRSYVLWRELMAPSVVLEFASGDGREERDQTPVKGKFWVYERIIRPPYYGIYEVVTAKLEVYELIGGVYQQLEPNERGHYWFPPLGVELGVWQGSYQNYEGSWLRWWDADGQLLRIGSERAEEAEERAEEAEEQAQQADERAERLAQKLRELGVEPDEI